MDNKKGSGKRTMSDSDAARKKGKTDLNKASFLRKCKTLNLYTNQDPFYMNAKVDVGQLEIDWR